LISTHEEPSAAADGKETFTLMSREALSRREIKVWQATIGHLRRLPVIPVDERAAEVRAIKAG